MPRVSLTTGRSLSRTQMIFAVAIIWTVVGVVLAVPEILTGGHWPNFAGKVIEAWAWAILTPLIIFADRYLAARQAKQAWRVAILLLFSTPISLAHVYATAIFQYPVREIIWSPLRDPSYAKYYFISGEIMYCAIIATLLALQYYKRYLTGQLELERVQRRLLQSHMNVLRLQLEPHFLFNALNAISSEVVSNPELARDMIEDLGALLRLSLDFKDRTEISLSQEIVILEHYLALQKVRYGNRLQVEVSLDPDVASAMVPCMLLQPLVENAIRHGISNRTSGGKICISASRSGGYVELRVADDGAGLPLGWQQKAAKGLGLQVTRERLEALYPEAARPFDIRGRNEGGTEVVLRVPLHPIRENSDEPASQ